MNLMCSDQGKYLSVFKFYQSFFDFSEKATKPCTIFLMGLYIYLVNLQTKWNIVQIFVAFSGKLNLTMILIAEITLSPFLHADNFWTQIPKDCHSGANNTSTTTSNFRLPTWASRTHRAYSAAS